MQLLLILTQLRCM